MCFPPDGKEDSPLGRRVLCIPIVYDGGRGVPFLGEIGRGSNEDAKGLGWKRHWNLRDR